MFKIDILGLQALFARFETAPARVAKKPEPIARRFAGGGQLGSVTKGSVKNFLRLCRISQHQKAEAVKLEQILFFFGHADFSAPNVTRLA